MLVDGLAICFLDVALDRSTMFLTISLIPTRAKEDVGWR
jgi:hypothetical protein